MLDATNLQSLIEDWPITQHYPSLNLKRVVPSQKAPRAYAHCHTPASEHAGTNNGLQLSQLALIHIFVRAQAMQFRGVGADDKVDQRDGGEGPAAAGGVLQDGDFDGSVN